MLQQLFDDKRYDQQLTFPLKNQAVGHWTPRWDQAVYPAATGPATYVYVPLEAPAVVWVGVKKYLRIKSTSGILEFSEATYLFRAKENAAETLAGRRAFFAGFTGTLLLRDLTTAVGAAFIYKKGVVQPRPTAKPSATTPPGVATNGTTSCYTTVTCYWTGYCRLSNTEGMVFATTTFGVDYCGTPAPDGVGCSDITWESNGSSSEAHCAPDPDPGPGPGDGGGGGSGGGGDGGPGQTFIPNMPTTMSKQVGAGGCVPASLTQVKMAICGGNQTEGQIEGAMFMYGIQQYGTNFVNDGVPLTGMSDFINHFFFTTVLNPAGNFQGAINAGYPVMIDVFSYMDGPNTKVYHSVVVTGYDSNNVGQVYYLDPGTGTTQTGDAASLFANSHYAIPIYGCK